MCIVQAQTLSERLKHMGSGQLQIAWSIGRAQAQLWWQLLASLVLQFVSGASQRNAIHPQKGSLFPLCLCLRENHVA
jgi:hypothetical protein